MLSAAKGSTLFWLRSKVMDSWVAFSASARPEVTASLATLASTQGLL